MRLAHTSSVLAILGGMVAASYDHVLSQTGLDGPINFTDCHNVHLIFARGMGEEPYMGTTVGPELVKALNDTLDLGPVDVHGFNYTANATSCADGCVQASQDMARLIAELLQRCENYPRIILAGYSQGAQVVHRALNEGTFYPYGGVQAAVVFGDPMNGVTDFETIHQKRFVSYCGSADRVCALRGPVNTDDNHMSYGNVAEEAASKVSSILHSSTEWRPEPKKTKTTKHKTKTRKSKTTNTSTSTAEDDEKDDGNY